jgi:hypothetical protein
MRVLETHFTMLLSSGQARNLETKEPQTQEWMEGKVVALGTSRTSAWNDRSALVFDNLHVTMESVGTKLGFDPFVNT